MKFIQAFIATFIVILNLSPAYSQNASINYQGHLKMNGVNSSGEFDMLFSIHADSITQVVLWSEPHNNVSVSNGFF